MGTDRTFIFLDFFLCVGHLESTPLLCGLSGLNVYPWPALHLHCNETFCPRKSLEISFSTIKFYVNNTPPGDYTCEPGLIPDDSFRSVSLFSNYLDSVSIEHGNMYASESKAVCQYCSKFNCLYCIIFVFYPMNSCE
jgi:hypothetical protein